MNLLCLAAALLALCVVSEAKPAALEVDRERGEVGVPHIIGGQDAVSGQFPYMMSMEYYGVTGWVHVCGMTLLKPFYAITSARCVNGINLINLRGYAGMLVRQNYTGAQQIYFNEALVYPSFDIYTQGSLGDIAIVRFSWVADDTRADIDYAVLPPDDSNTFVNPSCTTIGWGRFSSEQSFAWTLQWLQLPTLTNQACIDGLAGIITPFDDTLICTMDQGGIGPCSGDAGGPLMCSPNPGDISPMYFVGIVSYTTMRNQMCDEFTPVVYTRTSKYLQWIEENTQ